MAEADPGDGASIEVLRRHDPADRAAVVEALVAFNAEAAPQRAREPLAILVRDGAGAVSGGLWGRFTYDWLFVELLVVPAARRGSGLGRRLMALAEEAARAEGCAGIWLDTFGFQAPGFYAKLGFEPFGELPDHPRGGRRLFLKKRLD